MSHPPEAVPRDGLVDIYMEGWQAAGVGLAIQRRIRKILPVLEEHAGAAAFASMNRLSRMGFELSAAGKMTGLSLDDLEELARINEPLLAEALGRAGSMCPVRTGDAVLGCDRCAKAAAAVMDG